MQFALSLSACLTCLFPSVCVVPVQGCAHHSPLELLSALAVAIGEFPVWSSPEAETQAQQVAELCRSVGAAAWACALAVLLVDIHTVSVFRASSPAAWQHFVQLILADPSYAFLHEIVTVLSNEGPESAGPSTLSLRAGGPGSVVDGVGVGSLTRGQGVPEVAAALLAAQATDEGGDEQVQVLLERRSHGSSRDGSVAGDGLTATPVVGRRGGHEEIQAA